MKKSLEHTKYLTIHGHFYQPPRENPWLNQIELQESAYPNHDWNERISMECYNPNSVSRIVDANNKILSIVNNYEHMSFNFGPTLLSWMETYANSSYNRILEADKNSLSMYDGCGCAIAQVYNHIIMPLANLNDKYTQVIWGVKDFEHRFNRKPEGIWLAETAVDAETLEVLIDCGIKYTILSPYQAQKVRKLDSSDNWHDVSWGSIDPSMPYRYYPDSNDKKKYIDLFFYDGAISKSVAFDSLLKDGNKFAYRLQDGYVESRNRPQLVNIATDGESYGHHTKFGDMALSYVLDIKSQHLGFKITNYSWFLKKYPPQYQVDIKPQSAWSCAHGVGRWFEDCGCSTGAQLGWNQKWRKPLRDAFDYLRDELIKLCSAAGASYYKDFWAARNDYVEFILKRDKKTLDKFFKKHACKKLDDVEKVKAVKLMEIQLNAQLMYTSCGWFFAEISGIETTQILKYALYAMELASEFSDNDYETKFLSILNKAKSNIKDFGTGKDVYEKFVKPASISVSQVASQWAFSNKFSPDGGLDKIFCYDVKKLSVKTFEEKCATFDVGHIELVSNVTFEKFNAMYIIVETQAKEYYAAVKLLDSKDEFAKTKKECVEFFSLCETMDILKKLEEFSGNRLFTTKDILIDKRKVILEKILNFRLEKMEQVHKDLYEELKVPVERYMDLGMDIPDTFRVSAKYTLLHSLKDELIKAVNYTDSKSTTRIKEIKATADRFKISLNKPDIQAILSDKLMIIISDLAQEMNLKVAKNALGLLNIIENLAMDLNINEVQNLFFDLIYSKAAILIEHLENSDDKNNDRVLVLCVLDIAEKLNINTEFLKPYVDRASLPKRG